MPTKPAPALIAAPYAAPRCKIGGTLADRVKGDVIVDGITDAPVPWPYTRRREPTATTWIRTTWSPRPMLVLCGDLERAVRVESSMAVCHHWGVSKRVVTAWRRALGVGRWTEGTRLVRGVGPHAAALGRLRREHPPRRLAAIRSLIAAGESNWRIAHKVGVSVRAVIRVRAIMKTAAAKGEAEEV